MSHSGAPAPEHWPLPLPGQVLRILRWNLWETPATGTMEWQSGDIRTPLVQFDLALQGIWFLPSREPSSTTAVEWPLPTSGQMLRILRWNLWATPATVTLEWHSADIRAPLVQLELALQGMWFLLRREPF